MTHFRTYAIEDLVNLAYKRDVTWEECAETLESEIATRFLHRPINYVSIRSKSANVKQYCLSLSSIGRFIEKSTINEGWRTKRAYQKELGRNNYKVFDTNLADVMA